MLHFATHTHDVPAFSSPAFSTPAIWSRVFQSCVFQSRVFSVPPPLPSPSLPSSLLPLEVGYLQLGGLGSAVSSPIGVWKAPTDKRFGAYWSQKMPLWRRQFFFDFPKNKCNFLHKNKLDVVRRVQFVIGRRPMRSFLLGQSPPFPYGCRHLGIARQVCEFVGFARLSPAQ